MSISCLPSFAFVIFQLNVSILNMGAVLNVLKLRENQSQRVVMLGLDAAGKSTILACMNLGNRMMVKPTIGFNVDEVRVPNTNITFVVWDLGGQEAIRQIWKQYLENVSGLVFVVDSSDQARIPQARECLHALVRDPNLAGVPIVLVANKQDLITALPAVQMGELMGVNAIASVRNPCIVKGTVALTGEGVTDVFIDLAEAVRANARKWATFQRQSALANQQRENIGSGEMRRGWRERVYAHVPQMFKRNAGTV